MSLSGAELFGLTMTQQIEEEQREAGQMYASPPMTQAAVRSDEAADYNVVIWELRHNGKVIGYKEEIPTERSCNCGFGDCLACGVPATDGPEDW